MIVRSLIFLAILGSIVSCSSTKLINEWQQPDTVNYMANKVLVIGLTANQDAREKFETQMSQALLKEDIIAVRSLDMPELVPNTSKKTEKQISDLVNTLLDAGFDSIILTTVTGKEKKNSLLKDFQNINDHYLSFGEYYLNNQIIYAQRDKSEQEIYTTETLVYCLCPGKPKELLWKANITINTIKNMDRSISSYISLVIKKLRAYNLLIVL